MKRREFLSHSLKLALLAGSSTYLVEGLSYDNKRNQLLNINSKDKVLLLPGDPELYETTICVNITQQQLPIKVVAGAEKINLHDEDLIISTPGLYNFQFLGPYYGWTIV